MFWVVWLHTYWLGEGHLFLSEYILKSFVGLNGQFYKHSLFQFCLLELNQSKPV